MNADSRSRVCLSDSYESSWEGCSFQVTQGERFVVTIHRGQIYNSSTVLAVAWNNYPVPIVGTPAAPRVGTVAFMVVLLVSGTSIVRRRKMAKAAVLMLFLCTCLISCKGDPLLTEVDAASTDVVVVVPLPTPDASILDLPVLMPDVLASVDLPVALPEAPASVDLPTLVPDSLPSAVNTVTLDSGESCSGLIGTPAEIASTPRLFRGLELVAMNLDGGPIVASQGTYDRVVTDVTSRAAPISTGLMPPSGSMSGRTITLTVDDSTFASMQAGTYAAWDCLNSYYGLMSTDFLTAPNGNILDVVLKGTYNTELILGLYAALPGVVSVLSGEVPSDVARGSYQHICAGRVNDTYQYAFVYGSGDCESGCSNVDYYCYESTAAGVVAPLYGGVDGGSDRTQCRNLYTQLCQAYKIGN